MAGAPVKGSTSASRRGGPVAATKVDDGEPIEHPGRQPEQHRADVLLGRGVVDVRALVGDDNGDLLGVDLRWGQPAQAALVARLRLERALIRDVGAERADALELLFKVRKILAARPSKDPPRIVNAARHTQ